jgi:hypothetical protein
LPIFAQSFINADITIGGTSVLILVSVSLETLRAVESRALMVTYDQYSEPGFFTEASDHNPDEKTKHKLLPHLHRQPVADKTK